MADLKYKVVLDDSEARKKLAELLKNTGVSTSQTTSNAKAQSAAVKTLSDAQRKLKEAQIANVEAMRQGRIEAAKQKEEQAKLRAEFIKGQISMQEFRKEQAKLNAERKEQARAERELKKYLRENSSYGKLAKALNEVRKKTKDVLAEMWKIEQAGGKGSIAYNKLAHEARGLTAQTKVLDNGLKRIDATVGQHQRNVGNYASALEMISPQISSIDRKLGVFGTSIDDLAKGGKASIAGLIAGFKSLAAASIKFIATPIGAVLALVGGFFALLRSNKNTVKEFNSGLLNVAKTSGLADRELAKLSDGIIEMSRRLQTVSTDKLLEYATVAGQLGVKGRKNILNFSEALAKLETASNISGEEGGAEIARLLTLVDGGVQNVKDFGDEIVHLGNNFAATEKEILKNAEAIAQNTGLYNFGRKEVLAYAAATKAVGLEAEVVGSAMFRTLAQINKLSSGAKGSEQILSFLGKTQEELSTQLKRDASGVMMEFIQALNKVQEAGGNVDTTLEKLGLGNVRDIRVIGTLASKGYGQLERAIRDVNEAAGAMDREFGTASGKLENQWGRMSIAWQNFVLEVENGQGAIGKASVKIVGHFADILDSVSRLANSTSLKEFFFRFGMHTEAADSIRDINKSMLNTDAIMNDLSNAIRTNDSLETLEENYSKVTDAIDELKNGLEEYQKMDKKWKSNMFSDHSMQDFEERIRILQAFQAKLARVMDSKTPTPTAGTGGTENTEEDSAAKRAREKAKREARAAFERQRSLQGQIDQLNQLAVRSQRLRDEQEVESVRDKYKKIREEVDKFYRDPKNKNYRVDTSGLNRAEQTEITGVTFRHDTRELTKSLNEQLQLVKEYEQYKNQVGEEEAKKRYANELDQIQSYYARLADEYGKVKDSEIQHEKERADELLSMMKAFDKERQAQSDSERVQALLASRTTAEKLIEIQKQYEKDVLALGDDATEERLKNLNENRKKEISELISANYKKEQKWDEMFENIILMSRKASKKMLDDREADLKKMLESGKITADEYNRLMADITRGRGIIADKNTFASALDSIKKYREQVKKLGKDSKDAQKAQKEMFSEVSRALGDAVQIGDALSNGLERIGVGSESFRESFENAVDVMAAGADLAKSISSGNVVGIITSSINLLSSAIDLFNFKDKKIERRIKAYQNQLDSLGRTYDELERRINNAVGNEYYDNSREQIKNLQQQKKVLEEMMAAEDNKKKTDKQKMKSYQDQWKALDNEIKETEKNIKDNLLQTDFKQFSDNLANALLSAFESGESGIDALNKTFDDFIKNAVANSLKLKILEPIINEMMDQVSSYMAGNDGNLGGFNFTKWRKDLEKGTDEFNEGLSEILKGLGIEAGSEASSQGQISKGIQGITETTANRLEAEFGGLRLAQLELVEIARNTVPKQLQIGMDSLMQLQMIQSNTYRTAGNTDRLVNIETAIVDLNRKMSGTDTLRRGAGL